MTIELAWFHNCFGTVTGRS